MLNFIELFKHFWAPVIVNECKGIRSRSCHYISYKCNLREVPFNLNTVCNNLLFNHLEFSFIFLTRKNLNKLDMSWAKLSLRWAVTKIDFWTSRHIILKSYFPGQMLDIEIEVELSISIRSRLYHYISTWILYIKIFYSKLLIYFPAIERGYLVSSLEVQIYQEYL